MAMVTLRSICGLAAVLMLSASDGFCHQAVGAESPDEPHLHRY
jgi:hypothetical protein